MTILHVIQHTPVDFMGNWSYHLPSWVVKQYMIWYRMTNHNQLRWQHSAPTNQQAQARLRQLLAEYDPAVHGPETYYTFR